MTERMTPVRSWACTVPDVPPSFNEWVRQHWSKQQKTKQAWEKWIWALAHEKGNVCPRMERAEIRAVIFFDKARRRDTDNFTATLAKFVQDGLVAAGVIADDDAGRVTFHPVKIMAGEKPMTIISVEETEEAQGK